MYDSKQQHWKFSVSDIASMRFGYGIDIVRKNPQNKQDLLNHIDTPDRYPPAVANRPPLSDRVATLNALKKHASAIKKDKTATPKQMAQVPQKSRNYVKQQLTLDAHARFISAVQSQTPFFERLVFFWADHFSISAKNMGVQIVAFDYEQTAIRPHVDGYFYDMLRAVIGHPAMLRFLDNHISVGPNSKYITYRKRKKLPLNRFKGLNENLGRELLELHTLGVRGGYTQTDVTNTGQLLSGWTVNNTSHTFQFRADFAEPSIVTILGKSYGGADVGIQHMEALLKDLAKHPKTAEFVCMKLARHFISDHPPPHVVAHLQQVFLNTKGYLPSVYEALLNTDEAWQSFGQKTKRPFDHLVSGAKAVGLPIELLSAPTTGKRKAVGNNGLSIRMLASLNQILYHVSGPNGWADMAHNWITPQGITYRLLWAAKIARISIKQGGYLYRDNNNEKLYRVIRACMGDAPPDYASILVEGAPSKRDAIMLALINPAFIRR